MNLVSNSASDMFQTLEGVGVGGPMGHLLLLQTVPSSLPRLGSQPVSLLAASSACSSCFYVFVHAAPLSPPATHFDWTHPSEEAHMSTAQTLLFKLLSYLL